MLAGRLDLEIGYRLGFIVLRDGDPDVDLLRSSRDPDDPGDVVKMKGAAGGARSPAPGGGEEEGAEQDERNRAIKIHD